MPKTRSGREYAIVRTAAPIFFFVPNRKRVSPLTDSLAACLQRHQNIAVCWDKLSPVERSAAMKGRAKKRKRRNLSKFLATSMTGRA
jgi:hypothetical protein